MLPKAGDQAEGLHDTGMLPWSGVQPRGCMVGSFQNATEQLHVYRPQSAAARQLRAALAHGPSLMAICYALCRDTYR